MIKRERKSYFYIFYEKNVEVRLIFLNNQEPKMYNSQMLRTKRKGKKMPLSGIGKVT